MSRKTTPLAPSLTREAQLKTLVENRTVYNLEHCELNLFETYQQSVLVPRMVMIWPDINIGSEKRVAQTLRLVRRAGRTNLNNPRYSMPTLLRLKPRFFGVKFSSFALRCRRRQSPFPSEDGRHFLVLTY